MNFAFYVEKLTENEFFKNFKKKYKNAYCCSAFFIIDKIGNDSKQHFDFYIEGKKEMYSVKLESGGELVPVKLMDDKVLEEISLDLDFDFNKIEKMIQDKMNKEKIKDKIQKLLFSLQKKNNKHFLVGTIFITGLGMIKCSIDLEELKILDFEKKSFLDIMKVKKGKKKDKTKKKIKKNKKSK